MPLFFDYKDINNNIDNLNEHMLLNVNINDDVFKIKFKWRTAGWFLSWVSQMLQLLVRAKCV